jgi:hypothetical protein
MTIMTHKGTVPTAVCAAAVSGLIAPGAVGSIEMTWSAEPVSTSWNEVLNWVPPAGEAPSVPDTPQEAALVADLGGPATVTLDLNATIDYLHLDDPEGTLHLNGYTLTLVGPGSSSNAGLIVADPDINTIDGSFWNLGDLELEPSSLLILRGPEVLNTGVILVNTGPGVADSAVLLIEGEVALGHEALPGGELVLNGTALQPASVEVSPLSLLTNRPGHTIRGYGFLQGEVVNDGVIAADPGAVLQVTCTLFVNTGTASVTSLGGGTTHVQSGTVDVSAALTPITTIVDAGAAVTVGDLVYKYGGSMTINGTLSAAGGVELVSGAALTGAGSVQGDVLNTSGTVGPGSSVGTIELGSYTQQADGRLVVELGGTQSGQYDVLSVTGAAGLAGELQIDACRGFVAPPIGQTFTILEAAGGIAEGDAFDVLSPEWGSFSDSYDYEAGTATITVESWPPCVVEDVNRDGTVSVNDLLQVLSEWGPCPDGPCPGDVSGDGAVGMADVLQLLQAWGERCW